MKFQKIGNFVNLGGQEEIRETIHIGKTETIWSIWKTLDTCGKQGKLEIGSLRNKGEKGKTVKTFPTILKLGN